MSYGKKWDKSEDVRGSNDDGRGRTRRESGRQDRKAIDDEILALQEEFPGLSDAAIQAILKAGG